MTNNSIISKLIHYTECNKYKQVPIKKKKTLFDTKLLYKFDRNLLIRTINFHESGYLLQYMISFALEKNFV